MPRPLHHDFEGAWWHVYNRGAAKRAIFETHRDVTMYQDLLGRVVADGHVEVHAFSLLTTHFHLLARSPHGKLSEALQHLGQTYSRWFNRTRKRDGPLCRGRFGRRRLDDPIYWRTVLRYIDLNAPRAGMCRLPSDHEYGSARSYRYGGGPAWLSRGHVEVEAAAEMPGEVFDPTRYDAFATSAAGDRDWHLVNTLARRPSSPTPRFADLVRAASVRQQNWMRWKSALADGTVPGAAFLAPGDVVRAASTVGRLLGRRQLPDARSNTERDLRIALLHEACGLTATEVARRESVARSTVRLALERHERRMRGNPRYDEVVSRVMRTAVRRALSLSTDPAALAARLQIGASAALEVRAGEC